MKVVCSLTYHKSACDLMSPSSKNVLLDSISASTWLLYISLGLLSSNIYCQSSQHYSGVVNPIANLFQYR